MLLFQAEISMNLPLQIKNAAKTVKLTIKKEITAKS